MSNEAIVKFFLLEIKKGQIDAGLEENKDLAAALGISPQAVSRVLTGTVPLKLPLLLDICRKIKILPGEALDAAIERARQEDERVAAP